MAGVDAAKAAAVGADASPADGTRSGRRTITLEEHFMTAEALRATDHLRDAGLALTYHNPKLKEKLLDIGAGRIADMDASGIDLQVLSLAVCGVEELEPAQAQAIAHDTNEQLAAAVRAHPKRFAGFATLALQNPEKAAAELEYCVKELGFCGTMINGMTKGAFLDHPRCTPVLEAAQSLDAPIYIHPGPIPRFIREAYYSGLDNHRGDVLSAGGWGWHSEAGVQCLRLILAGVFDRFPKLKIIIGHMGEMIPFSLGRIDAIFARPGTNWSYTRTVDTSGPRLQRSVADYFRENVYVTTSAFFTIPPLLLALQIVGSDHLLFSVDYPFASNEAGRELLNALSANLFMGDKDLARFSHLNAEGLLKV
jgi:predicted TIM-barrel fold metal-dependent hydrolase